MFKRMLDSARQTASGEFQILGYFDLDDPRSGEYPGGLFGPRKYLGPAYQELFDICAGDIVMMCADDLVFKTKGWDQRVVEAMPKDLVGLVSFDDLSKKEHGHPFIGRKFIELMGYLCHPKIKHSCIDNWVVDIAKEVNRFLYLGDVVIHHTHPKYGSGEWDDTYKSNTKEIQYKDGEVYRHGKEERSQAVQAINQYLHA